MNSKSTEALLHFNRNMMAILSKRVLLQYFLIDPMRSFTLLTTIAAPDLQRVVHTNKLLPLPVQLFYTAPTPNQHGHQYSKYTK